MGRHRGIRAGCVALGAVVAALALAAPSGVLAKHHHHPKPMKVKIQQWELITASGTQTPGAPGATLTHCSSDVVRELDLHGHTKHAKAHKRFKVRLFLNGGLQLSTAEVYPASGRALFNDGIQNQTKGLDDGLWTVKVVQKGKTVGESSLTVASNPSC